MPKAVQPIITTPHCGTVAIVGRPNVGKSTLMNHLLGQKIAITSPKVQTTRIRQLGVLTIPEQQLQVMFVDTPGFSKPLDLLGETLVSEATKALADCDCIVFLVDVTEPAGSGDAWMAEHIKATGRFVLLLLNKVDRLRSNPTMLNTHIESYTHMFDGISHFRWLSISAKSGRGTHKIIPLLSPHIPEAPHCFDEDTLTNQRTRDIVSEMIREKAMRLTQDELPHAVAILIDQYDETNSDLIRISATLYVERESQKGIVIGKGGQLIKTIGQQARRDIEQLVGSQVFLDLRVKVKDNWRKDPVFLQQLGFTV